MIFLTGFLFGFAAFRLRCLGFARGLSAFRRGRSLASVVVAGVPWAWVALGSGCIASVCRVAGDEIFAITHTLLSNEKLTYQSSETLKICVVNLFLLKFFYVL